MKRLLHIFLFFATLLPLVLLAQPGGPPGGGGPPAGPPIRPPGSPPGPPHGNPFIPIDGGIGFLLAAGLGYGMYALRKRKES